MAHGQNTALLTKLGLAMLLGDGTPQNQGLIQEAENAIGPGNGAAKHDLVVHGVNDVLTAVVAGAAQNNPTVAQTYGAVAPALLGLFSTFITNYITARKAIGAPVQPNVPSPATPAAPQPAT